MTQSWRDTLETLDISPTPTATPAGKDGTWHQLLAVFGTSGFLRLLTDGSSLHLELAAPQQTAGAPAALKSSGWEIIEEGPPIHAERRFPSEADELRKAWVAAANWSDSIRNDDGAGMVAAMRSVDDVAPSETNQRATPSPTSSPAFESIGGDAEDNRPALQPGGFEFAECVDGDHVDVLLGFESVLEAADFERLERIVVRNLRAKYDLGVRVVPAHEAACRLPVQSETRLALRITPEVVVGKSDVAGVRDVVREYFETMAELSRSGVDPLVFLGVRTSGRLKAGASVPSAPRGQSTSTSPPRFELRVDESEAEVTEDSGTGVVFSIPETVAEGAALTPGRFDDPRLQRDDAKTALVDVVMRHPGYSDRRIGQVLSILLSTDYARCLELVGAAPVVIAWGVARDRAQTMKTVIEGAGGKVYLAEPGQFGEE